MLPQRDFISANLNRPFPSLITFYTPPCDKVKLKLHITLTCYGYGLIPAYCSRFTSHIGLLHSCPKYQPYRIYFSSLSMYYAGLSPRLLVCYSFFLENSSHCLFPFIWTNPHVDFRSLLVCWFSVEILHNPLSDLGCPAHVFIVHLEISLQRYVYYLPFLKMCFQSLCHIWLFVTFWTIAHQTPLSMRLFRQE